MSKNHTALAKVSECPSIKRFGSHTFLVTYKWFWFRRIYLLRCNECEGFFGKNRDIELAYIELFRLEWEMITDVRET